MTGFGGGPKIILPGVTSMETTAYNHGTLRHRAKESGIQPVRGMGRSEDNALILDIEEACRMSMLDVKIDAVVNENRDTTALFVGEPISEYHEGVKLAKQHYCAPRANKPDVVVANCNAKINESGVGVVAANSLLPEAGGTVVMISNNPYGEVPHYLMRRFGDHISGSLWREPSLPRKMKKFIFLTPYKDRASMDWILPLSYVTWTTTWEEVFDILNADHPSGARVAVIPDATIQFFE
jgi:nickel-dependent lactate racemase